MGIDVIPLRDGSTTQDPRLDRIPFYDERSRSYPIREMLGARKARSYTHNFLRYPGWLNQFAEGACVGFGWAHELMVRPAEISMTNEAARSIYHRAQAAYDPWPGGSYPGASPFYEGTSVLAGAKATQELVNEHGQSRMPEYRWGFGGDDLLLTLGYSPVVAGLDWTDGMFDTDAQGFIHPTGRVLGGHCVLLRGIKVKWRENTTHYELKDVERELTVIRGRNSWGRAWGQKGDFFITLSAMDKLLGMGGEVCVPVIRNR